MKQCARNSPEGVSLHTEKKGKKHKTQPQGGKKLDCQQKYKKKGKCAKKKREWIGVVLMSLTIEQMLHSLAGKCRKP